MLKSGRSEILRSSCIYAVEGFLLSRSNSARHPWINVPVSATPLSAEGAAIYWEMQALRCRWKLFGLNLWILTEFHVSASSTRQMSNSKWAMYRNFSKSTQSDSS
jgi:hypothetical protein